MSGVEGHDEDEIFTLHDAVPSNGPVNRGKLEVLDKEVPVKKRKKVISSDLDEDDVALIEENTGSRVQRASGTVGALRRLSKKARADEEPVTVAVGGEGNDAARALEEGLFGA